LIYASQNDYHFRALTPADGSEYFPEDQRWNKVKILEDALEVDKGWASHSDYIVWLDSDLIFLDLGLSLRDVVDAYPESDMIMSADKDLSLGVANTGLVIVKNTAWSRSFLNLWWNSYNKSLGMDQHVLTKLWESGQPDIQNHITILRQDALNSAFPSWLKQQPYNQVLHLAGANKEMRQRAFQYGLKQICDHVQIGPVSNFPHHIPLNHSFHFIFIRHPRVKVANQSAPLILA
jgi:hypothetical protein